MKTSTTSCRPDQTMQCINEAEAGGMSVRQIVPISYFDRIIGRNVTDQLIIVFELED